MEDRAPSSYEGVSESEHSKAIHRIPFIIKEGGSFLDKKPVNYNGTHTNEECQ